MSIHDQNGEGSSITPSPSTVKSINWTRENDEKLDTYTLLWASCSSLVFTDHLQTIKGNVLWTLQYHMFGRKCSSICSICLHLLLHSPTMDPTHTVWPMVISFVGFVTLQKAFKRGAPFYNVFCSRCNTASHMSIKISSRNVVDHSFSMIKC